MATYFISDIHGEYGMFCELLNKIGFSKSDRLIILGDIFDKGDEGVRLARFISNQKNMQMIIGNHEHFFLRFADNVLLSDEYKTDDEALAKINSYFSSEQESPNFQPINFELLDYLFSLPYYIEEEKFICVHASLELDSDNKILPMAQQRKEVMIFGRDFMNKRIVINSDKAVLFGHTPCSYENGTGHFIKQKRDENRQNCNKIEDYSKIQLDTGVMINNMLGCLRLEDMQEFYVK